MPAVKDRIERVVTLPVPIERVWTAITDPAEVRQWFGDQSDYELRTGGEGLLKWGDDGFRMRIETVDPPHRFSYRWVTPRDDDHSIPFEDLPTTLVEFVLESVPEGTRLTLTESGFASHPEDQRESSYADNSQGWTDELGELVEYIKRLAAA